MCADDECIWGMPSTSVRTRVRSYLMTFTRPTSIRRATLDQQTHGLRVNSTLRAHVGAVLSFLV